MWGGGVRGRPFWRGVGSVDGGEGERVENRRENVVGELRERSWYLVCELSLAFAVLMYGGIV